MHRKKYLLYVGLMVLIIFSGCSSNESDSKIDDEDLDNVHKEGLPIVDDEISINFFAGEAEATNDDWNDVMIYNEYEEMTNINVDWKMVHEEGLEEQRNLALGSEKLPDAFHSANIPPEDLYKYGNQGVLLPLNDLIEDYAPNLQELFEEYPEIKDAITYPDGNIYALPTLDDPDFLSLRMSTMPWFREDWLDELDMDIPETTDEFYEYLKAVKESDMIGDGDDEEIPFGAQSIGELVGWLKGSFGVGNRGTSAGFLDKDPNKDKVRFYPITDEFKELLEYAHKLYDEELIEQNIFSLDHDQFYANGGEGLYGSVFLHDPETVFGGDDNDKYVGGKALEGPGGKHDYAQMRYPIAIPGSFAITSENDHPAATMRWADYFYGDEGKQLFFMGKEGETFENTDDGDYEFVDKIADNPDGLTLNQAVADYLTWPGGNYPSIVEEKYFKGAESSDKSLKTADQIEPDKIEEFWPSFTYTDEENKKLSGFGADIEKYVGEMQDKFIKGEESFDEWDNYVETIKEMGLDEYMEIQQDAYERYKDN